MGQARNWTENEYEYLESYWGKHTIPEIAKALNRSPNAVKIKIVRRKLGRATLNAECLNAHQTSDLLGIDIHTVTDCWTVKCGLKYTKKAPHGVKKQMFIKVTDLLKWLERNQDKWDSRRVEKFALGTEPDWLKQKRLNDSGKPKNKAQKWTAVEDDKLELYYYKLGYTYVQIGETMGRSTSAVKHRILRLIKKRKALKMGEFWQKETCQNWKNGCLRGENNCDECSQYKRVTEYVV